MRFVAKTTSDDCLLSMLSLSPVIPTGLPILICLFVWFVVDVVASEPSAATDNDSFSSTFSSC